jgi:hypothetical protein
VFASFDRQFAPHPDLGEPYWARIAQELKHKSVTLTLLCREYRATGEIKAEKWATSSRNPWATS